MSTLVDECTTCGERLVTRDIQRFRDWDAAHPNVCIGEKPSSLVEPEPEDGPE